MFDDLSNAIMILFIFSVESKKKSVGKQIPHFQVFTFSLFVYSISLQSVDAIER